MHLAGMISGMTPDFSSTLQLIQISKVPQYVPGAACRRCDVCCRFPEADSFLRPYFTDQEIRQAVKHGISPAQFPDPAGSQISLVPNPAGEGYVCPAFDPVTTQCQIYDVRPLDCQIYPLAVMWAADHTHVVLGWDSKCPFLRTGEGREAQGEGEETSLEAYADRMAALIQQNDAMEQLAAHPHLIGPFQDDVVILRPLPKLTDRINIRQALAPCRLPLAPFLRPLTLSDQPRFARAMAAIDTPLSHYGFAAHYIWRRHFHYGWRHFGAHWCLFAQYEDGIYMPLPPLGPGAPEEPLARAFDFMRECNGDSAVSRVENVPESLVPMLSSLGYHLSPKDPDYLYRASDLAALAGDRYKSQRAACNRLARIHQVEYQPYQDTDRAACEALYRVWAGQQEARHVDDMARQMVRDAALAHEEVLAACDALGLVGRVVRIKGVIHGYTFGYARSASVFSVLLEIADRTVPGLAQFMFRELCREAAARGYPFINTMDDSGLPGLRASKEGYRPVRLVPSFIATEPDCGPSLP
ncbi:MAG TPA: phosphatidylglycerol lysyltransferase domain-containing protein [Nitrospiraceae bacterium]|nr:phosphatidylglycerol lysyltransferase domain-containing protein [Nitrospiraceae bacterium]